MSTFTTPLVVTPLDDGKNWYLLEKFEYHVGKYPSNDIVYVPKRFKTDFASVPRIFWYLFPPWGKYGKAAVVHDYLCRKKDRPSNEVHRIFYDAMLILDVPKWKAWTMWLAVRCCGPKF